jgi:hypothetical protein
MSVALAYGIGGILAAAGVVLSLVAFVALAVVVAILSVRSAPRGWPALERSLESSSQLPVRVAALLVFGLAELATKLGPRRAGLESQRSSSCRCSWRCSSWSGAFQRSSCTAG